MFGQRTLDRLDRMLDKQLREHLKNLTMTNLSCRRWKASGNSF